jgi:urease accessory protein
VAVAGLSDRAFSYSSGIEWAVEAGDHRCADDPALARGDDRRGGGFCDAVFFVHAFHAIAAGDDATLRAVAELAAAFAPSKERHLETTAQGRAFLDTTRAAWPAPALERLLAAWEGDIALPVAVGVVCAGHGVPLDPALHAYLEAMAANLISTGVRLVPLGQTDGQRILAALEPVVAATAKRALVAVLDDVGGAAFRADLASMPTRPTHEAVSLMTTNSTAPASGRRPVGSARPAMDALWGVARGGDRGDHQRHLAMPRSRAPGALPAERIAGVETGGCSYGDPRDASINLAAVVTCRRSSPRSISRDRTGGD